jgi:hypothetical protein
MKISSKKTISAAVGGVFGLATFFFSLRRVPDYSKGVEARDVFKSPDAAANALGKITLQSWVDLFHALIVAAGAMIGWCGTQFVLNKLYPTKETNEGIDPQPAFSHTGRDEIKKDTAEKSPPDGVEWRRKVKAEISPNRSENQIPPQNLQV